MPLLRRRGRRRKGEAGGGWRRIRLRGAPRGCRRQSPMHSLQTRVARPGTPTRLGHLFRHALPQNQHAPATSRIENSRGEFDETGFRHPEAGGGGGARRTPGARAGSRGAAACVGFYTAGSAAAIVLGRAARGCQRHASQPLAFEAVVPEKPAGALVERRHLTGIAREHELAVRDQRARGDRAGQRGLPEEPSAGQLEAAEIGCRAPAGRLRAPAAGGRASTPPRCARVAFRTACRCRRPCCRRRRREWGRWRVWCGTWDRA